MTAAGPLRKFKSIEGGKRLSRLPVASALRTLDLECDGLSLLRQALSTTMARAFEEALQATAAAARPRHRHRHRQERPRRPEDRGHVRLDRHAGLLRAPDRGHPRRPRHDHAATTCSSPCPGRARRVELGNILTYSRRFKVPLIAITSRADSTLGQAVRRRAGAAARQGGLPARPRAHHLHHHAARLGDCLAIALLETKGFTAHDFKVFHPGGSLGANLKFVADVMHTGERLPLVAEDTSSCADALVTMTQKSFGCLGVVDGKGKLVGMITDGDLRRHMGADLLKAPRPATS